MDEITDMVIELMNQTMCRECFCHKKGCIPVENLDCIEEFLDEIKHEVESKYARERGDSK